MNKTIKIIIKGQVQSVGFRNFVKDHALILGLKGYAKNTSDGKLEVLVDGPQEKINELIKLCKIGPSSSKIIDVEVIDINSKYEFNSFNIIWN